MHRVVLDGWQELRTDAATRQQIDRLAQDALQEILQAHILIKGGRPRKLDEEIHITVRRGLITVSRFISPRLYHARCLHLGRPHADGSETSHLRGVGIRPRFSQDHDFL